MKKLLSLLLLTTSIVSAQYTVKGAMTPPGKNDWVMLHKLEGVKPKYIANTTIKLDTVAVGGDQQILGRFAFTLPKDATPGIYRATYKNQGNGFIDFLFNNETVEFIFNPVFPEESIIFTSSRENKLHTEYLQAYANGQKKIDSLLIEYIKSPTKSTKKEYKKAVSELEDLQDTYQSKTKGMLVHHFIKASQRYNSSSVFDTMDEYLEFTSKNFFKNVDFDSDELYNSSFFLDKINDYVFYLNTSDDIEVQTNLYKKSIKAVFDKISDDKLRSEIIKFLINSFTDKRNGEIVDWLFAEYFTELDSDNENETYKAEKLELLRATVGRTAPNFTWNEAGKEYSLESINDGEKYLLVFWSTGCPHCVKEVPDLHKFMEKHQNVSVISFGIESNDVKWKEFINKIPNWHNAIGTHPDNKWDNETVRAYQLIATPSYFILDKDKKIIAMPNELTNVKSYFEKPTGKNTEE